MKKNFSFIIIFYTCSLLFSNIKNEWISNPYADYSRETFLCFVGEGSSKKLAQLDAVNKLASYFGQNVDAHIFSTEDFSQTTNDTVSFTNRFSVLEKETSITINQDNLVCIDYPKNIYDKKNGIWYVLATMDKQKALITYASYIESNNATISSLLSETYNNSLQYFANLNIVKTIQNENKKITDRILLLDSSFSEGQTTFSKSYIEKEILSVSINNPIFINVLNDDGNIKSILINQLSKQNLTISDTPNSKCILSGKVEYNYFDSNDKNTIFCEVIFNAHILDTSDEKIYFPIDVKFREGSKNIEQTKSMVEKKLSKIIETTYSSFYEKN